MPRRTSAAAAGALACMAFLGACTYSRWFDLVPPTALTASTGELDRVVLEWEPVRGAGIYYVYRAGAEPDPFAYLGFSVYASYVDTDVRPELHYRYRVTAADLRGENETAPSPAAEGWSEHEFAWTEPQTLSLAAGLVEIAADPQSGELYALWSGTAADAALNVERRDTEEGWTALGDPFGVVNTSGETERPAALAVSDGIAYVAYADASASGRVTVRAFVDESWELVGAEGFTPREARWVGLGASPRGLWVAAFDQAGSVGVWHSTGGAWTAEALPVTVPAVAASLAMGDGLPTVAYVVAGLDPSIRFLSASDSGSWSAEPTPLDAGELADGAAVALAPGADGSWLAASVGPSGEVSVRRSSAGSWGAELWDAGIAAFAGFASIAVCETASGTAALFYRDASSYRGTVRAQGGAAWELLGGDDGELTARSGLAGLRMVASGNELHAAFLEGTAARVTSWE